MWTATCVDEVSEVVRAPDRSLVIGWPMTNVVATFDSVDFKQQFEAKLERFAHTHTHTRLVTYAHWVSKHETFYYNFEKNCFNVNENWYTQPANDVMKLQYYKTVLHTCLPGVTVGVTRMLIELVIDCGIIVLQVYCRGKIKGNSVVRHTENCEARSGVQYCKSAFTNTTYTCKQ